MTNGREREYLESQIMTSSKEDLMLLLFDGAVRFANQAKPKLVEKDFEASGTLLIKAQNIVLELTTCLKREDLGDQIFEHLVGLYKFVHERLIKANMEKTPGAIDEAVKILSHLRETWAMAFEENQKGQFAAAVAAIQPEGMSSGPTLDLAG